MLIDNVMVEVLKDNDINEYSALINEVMNEFNKEEIDDFQIWFASVEGIIERREYNDFSKHATVQFAAKYNGKIVGALEIEDANHIQQLFVKKEFQKQGVGRKLLKVSIKYFIDNGVKQKGYSVKSSDFGLGFYKKLGFMGDKWLYMEIKYEFTERILLFYNIAFHRLQEMLSSLRLRLSYGTLNTSSPTILEIE